MPQQQAKLDIGAGAAETKDEDEQHAEGACMPAFCLAAWLAPAQRAAFFLAGKVKNTKKAQRVEFKKLQAAERKLVSKPAALNFV
jgi:hypothetical protein